MGMNFTSSLVALMDDSTDGTASLRIVLYCGCRWLSGTRMRAVANRDAME